MGVLADPVHKIRRQGPVTCDLASRYSVRCGFFGLSEAAPIEVTLGRNKPAMPAPAHSGSAYVPPTEQAPAWVGGKIQCVPRVISCCSSYA
jgi:hypothetical protein